MKPQNFLANGRIEDCQGGFKCVLRCEEFLDCSFQRGRSPWWSYSVGSWQKIPFILYNSIAKLSRFTSNHSRQHWKAITRVFKYLRGTKNYGLSYVGYPSVLEGYSDASWINHVEDSSSTSGWVFFLEGGAISWASKKKTCITGSTMESEFVALAAAGKEAEG
nr:zinc finger, CCHC-type [Tanacetum cinerariifolium]